ncbi:PAS domain S-box protein [Ferruginivarius sediminum]|uniref:PAS domain S-box protein n=1 Tax=Ferruginivarius sediminum TaxID=2661937 RepID=UPI00137AB3EC|nr:PAS domain S-box protein [Ferruginivarius sediminum]
MASVPAASPAHAATQATSSIVVPWVLVVTLAVVVSILAVGLMRSRRALGLFQDSFDSIPHPRQVVDADGTPLRTNRAFRDHLTDDGSAMPDVVERRANGREAGEEVRRLAERAAAGGSGHAEVPLTRGGGARGGGERIWLDVRAQPMRERAGVVLWSAEDITARRQIQDVLEDEQARFIDLLEHAPIGFYSVDQDGCFLFANSTLAGWLGVATERLTSGKLRLHDIVEAAGEAGAPAFCPFPDWRAREGQTAHGEVEMHGPSGHGFEAHVTQEVVPGEGGAISTRSVVRNLTQERAIAEALERSERRFRRFFEKAPVGIALVDGEGCVSECNAAFARTLQQAPHALVGQRLTDLVREQDRDNVAATLSGEVESPAEVRVTDGGIVCALFATALDESDGQKGGVVHLIDTTEQKNLEEQFAQSQKMQAVGQLAGGIAHDFNNLLTAMIGFCDLLLLRHRPGDQSFADLMQVKQNANRAANLVRQLLAFSRQQTLRPTVLSVTDVLAELMHLLRRLIGENIELEISHGRDLHPVKVDQGQLEQVIINLAVNARDAMIETGGRLAIQTRNSVLEKPIKREGETVPPGDYVLIEIADSGCGIPRENLDRIFEPFFSTKELGAGTGLGLSTVYGIVKQTGGFILVDSAVGEGTTFQIFLPRHRESHSEAAARDVESQQARDLTGMGTLLLVEDEDAVRSFSARALRKKGYTVLEAGSGEQALEMLKDESDPVDLLITDVVMPQVDGPTLVKRVRESRPSLKVIFISGYTEGSFRKHLDDDSGVHFLAKPFSLKQLAGTVKEVLHEPGA